MKITGVQVMRLISNGNGDPDRDGMVNPCDPDADNDPICNNGAPLTGLAGLLPGGCQPGPRLLRAGGADNCVLDHNPSQTGPRACRYALLPGADAWTGCYSRPGRRDTGCYQRVRVEPRVPAGDQALGAIRIDEHMAGGGKRSALPAQAIGSARRW